MPATQSDLGVQPPKKKKRQATSGAATGGARPLLVLLDLNGVLVHRASKGRGASFSVRPGTLALLRALHGHVDVAFCSSMRAGNARRALQAIAEAAREPGDKLALRVLFDAPLFAGDDFHFRNDVGVPLLPLRVPTLEPWRMLRNLKVVWADPRARGHEAASTILCDDTPGKCPLSPRNVLLVPSWAGPLGGMAEERGGPERASGPRAEEDVERGLLHDELQQTRTLRELANQLLKASEAQVAAGELADVRGWLEAAKVERGDAPII